MLEAQPSVTTQHLQITATHSKNSGIKLTINELEMSASIPPVNVEGRYFWVDGKRVGVLSPWGPVSHGLISLLTSHMGHSSW